METILQFDTSLFRLLNDLIEQSASFDSLVYFFAHWLTPIVLVLVVADIIRRDVFSKTTLIRDALSLSITLTSAYGFTQIIRELVGRVRPLWELGTPYLLQATSPSFPSGHTTFMFALATFLYLFGEKRAAWIVYVLGAVVGISRVVAGVHYPFDILGGAIVGVLMAWAVQFVLRHGSGR